MFGDQMIGMIYKDDLRVKTTSETKSSNSQQEGADEEGKVQPGESKMGGNHPGGEGGRQQEAEQNQDVAGPSQGLCSCVHLRRYWAAPRVVGTDNGGDQDVESEEQYQGERHQHCC